MDGLECSEILLSKVQETYDFRTEAEFYKKEFVAIHKKLIALDAVPLANGLSSLVTDGTHYTPNYTESGIPFLSALNVQENYLDVSAGFKYISAEQHKELSRRVLPQYKDVLLRKVGVGMRKACVVPRDAFEFSIFVSVALIRPKINSYLLSTYINSRFGQLQLLRFNKGISQPDLHLEDIGRMLVPIFSNTFISAIETLVLSAESLLKQSAIVFGEATNILNDCLKINTNGKRDTRYSIKQYSKSFESTGRLDAEYYDYKYEHIESQLIEAIPLKKSCWLHDDTFIPNDTAEYQYIELSNVDKVGGISNVEIIIGKDLPNRARRLVKTGQVIVSSIEGSLPSCALITSKYNNALCSTGFYVVDSPNYNSETLLLLFKSEPIQAMLKKRCSGTILTGISKDEFERMPLPHVNESVQKIVACKVQESFQLRDECANMLDLAVKTVEMAIEIDEATALEWIKDKVGW